jgi:Domain of unknown function (DUF6852)/Domain of unknown function (DUF5606)
MKDLTEVASILGRGGLFKVLKPGRSGVVLESLDDKKVRMVTNPTHKVSILSEISIYTNTEEGSAPLEDIFKKIYAEFGEDPGVDNKSTPDELMSFLEYILPEYDTMRVYPSDAKKLVNWYGILCREAPELLKEQKEEESGKEKKKKSETQDSDVSMDSADSDQLDKNIPDKTSKG